MSNLNKHPSSDSYYRWRTPFVKTIWNSLASGIASAVHPTPAAHGGCDVPGEVPGLWPQLQVDDGLNAAAVDGAVLIHIGNQLLSHSQVRP